MIVVGLIGMPKSGKSEISKTLVDEGYTVIRMSSIIASIAQERGIVDPTREQYRQIARNGRHGNGNRDIAQIALSMIQEQEQKRDVGEGKYVIDGIRHPKEIGVFLANIVGMQFVQVIADEDRQRDREIRFGRLGNDPYQRGRGFELPQWDAFLQQDQEEWGKEGDPDGNQIGLCFELLRSISDGRTIINGEHTSLDELARLGKGLAKDLEGRRNGVER